MKRYSLVLTKGGAVILDGLDKAHARPQYTPNDANAVIDWLNGNDRPLAWMTKRADRPLTIPERRSDNRIRAFRATYDANVRRRGQYD